MTKGAASAAAAGRVVAHTADMRAQTVRALARKRTLKLGREGGRKLATKYLSHLCDVLYDKVCASGCGEGCGHEQGVKVVGRI